MQNTEMTRADLVRREQVEKDLHQLCVVAVQVAEVLLDLGDVLSS